MAYLVTRNLQVSNSELDSLGQYYRFLVQNKTKNIICSIQYIDPFHQHLVALIHVLAIVAFFNSKAF